MQVLQVMEIKYLGATNNRGSRAKIKDLRFDETVTINNQYTKSLNDQVADYLKEIGYNIVAQAELGVNKDCFLVDNFSPLSEMKKGGK